MDTGPVYAESATIVFEPPAVLTSSQQYLQSSMPLITTASVMAQTMMTPQSQHRAGTAGGTAGYTMEMVNLYNQDYPDFGYPMATLTTTAPNPATAHRTFVSAVRLLDHLLAARQALAPVKPGYRISARVIADSGPVSRAGSRKRVFAGLAVLAVIGAVAVRNFFLRRAVATAGYPGRAG